MKKVLRVYGIIFGIVFIIAVTIFLGNFIRNVWIINKAFGAKEIYENNNNYKIDREIHNEGETKQRTIIYNKDDKQRIDTYSWHGMSIHEKYRVDSSVVTTDDSEKLDYKNEIFIDASKVNKKELIKQYLLDSISIDSEKNSYKIVYYEKTENNENINYKTYYIDKDNFWIKEYDNTKKITEYDGKSWSVEINFIIYDIEFNTLTDKDLVEGEVYEN